MDSVIHVWVPFVKGAVGQPAFHTHTVSPAPTWLDLHPKYQHTNCILLNTAWPISSSLFLANSHILLNPFLIICVAPRSGGLPGKMQHV